jgi:HAD superfamily hydrolase (TIGR01509 family)
MLEALIFDVDGTLAETEEVHRRAFNDAFAEADLDWHWDVPTYAGLLKVTGGKERIAAWQRQLGQAPDPELIARLHAAKTSVYVAAVASGGLCLRPGIDRMMRAARKAGLRLAIATTTSRPNVDAMSLSLFGHPSDEVFDVIAAGDEVARKKPAPDVYNLALARLGLSPASCLAVEDSANGVAAAIGAGLRVLACPGMYGADDDLGSATLRLDSFADAPDIAALGRLGRAAA